jgi:hypothetical protein
MTKTDISGLGHAVPLPTRKAGSSFRVRTEAEDTSKKGGSDLSSLIPDIIHGTRTKEELDNGYVSKCGFRIDDLMMVKRAECGVIIRSCLLAPQDHRVIA